jgi:tetratricopeptide (TPR) repeat protein
MTKPAHIMMVFLVSLSTSVLVLLLPSATAQIQGRGTGICWCALTRDHRPCGTCPTGGSIPPEPSGPTPQEVERRRREQLEEKLHEANDQGLECFKARNWTCAIAKFREALRYSPDDPDILHNLRRAQEKAREAQAEEQRLRDTRARREKTDTVYHRLKIEARLPAIDPGFFAMPGEARFLREQISALSLKRKLIQNQLAGLERSRESLNRAANEIDQVRHELIADSSIHALNIIDVAIRTLTNSGHVPAPSAAQMANLITVAKAGLNGLAAATAEKDSQRQLEKAIDALFNLKNLINVSPNTLSPGELTALKRATDTLPKLLKISERIVNSKPDRSALKEFAANLDDAFDAAGQLFLPLKAARSTVHILEGEVAFWHLHNDRGQIEEAFVRSQTAKRYYLDRLAKVDELTAFYKERLRRVEKK